MCVEALLKSAIRHMQVLVHRFKAQGRQARDRRAAAALSGYLYVLESSVWVCEEAVSGPDRAMILSQLQESCSS